MPILALDVGTSSVKAGVLDQASGDPLAPPVKAAYQFDRPTPDAAELRPEVLWDAVSDAARKAVAAVPRGTPPVDGVGFSVLSPALFLLDDKDQVLAPAWLHLDRRSRPVSRKVLADAGDEFLATTGNRPLPGGMSALSFAQQCADRPDLRGKVRHYLHVNGWLGLRLTGERRFDPGNASFTGVFDTVGDRRWSARWCDYFGVEPKWLPEVVDGTTTLGGLRQEVADDWKLPAGVPVKMGVIDSSSAILAFGVGGHDILHSVGTTQVLACLAAHPRPDARRLTRLHGVGGKSVYVTHNPVGGAAFEWLHQLLYRDQGADEFYQKTIVGLAGRPGKVRLDPPFLGGDRLEIEEKVAAFLGVTLDDTRDDLLVAVIDAMRAGHRSAVAALDIDPDGHGRVFLTGGGADAVRAVLPEYATTQVLEVQEESLRGVARLFDPPPAG